MVTKALRPSPGILRCATICIILRMDENRTSAPESTLNPGKWIGQLVAAVILAEGIWGFLASLTSNLLVPLLARVMEIDPQSPLYLGKGGAGAHANHEPAASGSVERRIALPEAAVAGSGTGATGGIPVSPVAEPAATRSAGVAGPAEPDDHGVDTNHRTGSGEVSCGAALEDASRGRFADGAGLRADHRASGTVSVWQADRELSGTGTVRGVQRRSATAGTHQQARQHAAAFPAGGSGASDGAQPSGMAEQVFSPGHGTRAEDCQGRDGPQVSHSAVLDDAQGMGLRASKKIRSARGTARTSPWCAVEHRVIDWASRSSLRGSSN